MRDKELNAKRNADLIARFNALLEIEHVYHTANDRQYTYTFSARQAIEVVATEFYLSVGRVEQIIREEA